MPDLAADVCEKAKAYVEKVEFYKAIEESVTPRKEYEALKRALKRWTANKAGGECGG